MPQEAIDGGSATLQDLIDEEGDQQEEEEGGSVVMDDALVVQLVEAARANGLDPVRAIAEAIALGGYEI